jgi:cyclase
MKLRIVSRLDVKGPNLVKGVNLEGLRIIGKPQKFANAYYEDGIDELIYIDTVASLYGRNSLLDLVRLTAKNFFVPLTVGGGVRTIDDIKEILRAGADKVSINSAAIKNPNFIKEAVKKFGTSTIVIGIEAQKNLNGIYKCHIENGRQSTDLDPLEWALKAEELGAGEIFVTAIHKEGTGSGFDKFLLKKLTDKLRIPVIASGGAGSLSSIKEVVDYAKVDAVCIASMFHYSLVEKDKHNNKNEVYEEGNTDFLNSNLKGYKGELSSIKDVKDYLIQNNINCRKVHNLHE